MRERVLGVGGVPALSLRFDRRSESSGSSGAQDERFRDLVSSDVTLCSSLCPPFQLVLDFSTHEEHASPHAVTFDYALFFELENGRETDVKA